MSIIRSKVEEDEKKQKKVKEERKKEVLKVLKSFPDQMFSLKEITKKTGVKSKKLRNTLYGAILELDYIDKKIENKKFKEEEYWGIAKSKTKKPNLDC